MNMEEITWLIKEVHISMEQYGRTAMKTQDITFAEASVLFCLLEHSSDNFCSRDIYGVFRVSKATVSAILKNLRKKGYLEMTALPEDERRKQITLTDKAYRAREKIQESLEHRSALMCRGIPPEEIAVTKECLKKILNNLKQEE